MVNELYVHNDVNRTSMESQNWENHLLVSLQPTPLLHRHLQSGCWTCWRAAICQNASGDTCREKAAYSVRGNSRPCLRDVRRVSQEELAQHCYPWMLSRLLPVMGGTAGNIAVRISERQNAFLNGIHASWGTYVMTFSL